jgi:3-hydroxyisobutyrate dehydrogenase
VPPVTDPAQQIETVALLGAGSTMGKGIARNLCGAGIGVRAWNRSPGKLEDLRGEPGFEVCETPAEAAGGAGAVITMVSDGDAVLAVMEGPDGAAGAAAEGTIWVQASTIGIEATERCRALAGEAGLVLVDAPVLGTKQPAEAGELVVLAAGPEAAREPLRPVFEAIGKKTLWVGEEPGAGSRLKLVINTWILTAVEGTAEVVALAAALGVDPELAFEAFAGGPLELPYMRAKAKSMLAGEFEPALRLALGAKDARLAADAAAADGLSLPALEAVAERFAAAVGEHGEKDISAVYLATRSTS